MWIYTGGWSTVNLFYDLVIICVITCLLSLCLYSKNMHRVDMESVEITNKVQSFFVVEK